MPEDCQRHSERITQLEAILDALGDVDAPTSIPLPPIPPVFPPQVSAAGLPLKLSGPGAPMVSAWPKQATLPWAPTRTVGREDAGYNLDLAVLQSEAELNTAMQAWQELRKTVGSCGRSNATLTFSTRVGSAAELHEIVQAMSLLSTRFQALRARVNAPILQATGHPSLRRRGIAPSLLSRLCTSSPRNARRRSNSSIPKSAG